MDIYDNLDQYLGDDIYDRCDRMVADVEQAFNVRLTFHDHMGVMRTPEGRALVPHRGAHTHYYCCHGRIKGSAYDKRCLAHCGRAVPQRCRDTRQTFITHCWKDNHEVIVPILRGNQHVLTIFVGGFRDKDDKPRMNSKAEAEELSELYQTLNPLSIEITARIARIVRNLGLGLLKEVEGFHHLDENQQDRETAIKRFIHYNAHRDIHLEDLAEVLFLSASRAGHVVKELFNTSFQDMLMKERIERAKTLLTTTRRKQDMIALQCGFKNPFYFNRAFTKTVGTPPGKYRKAHTIKD